MARYKPADFSQGQFIPISFEKQILPGSFEHAVHFVINESWTSRSSTRLTPTTMLALRPTTRG